MSTMGTFDAFTTARLGIYAAQHGLRVTGNNVSNINTEGYTRQRLDQVSFKAGAYDMYRSQLDNHVGSGALVMNINQVRDPYLDVRFRNVSADVGYNDTLLAGLQNIADILDEVGEGEDTSDNEVGDGRLHAQIQDLADKIRAWADEPTEENDGLVRNSASVLCQILNQYADKLDILYKETVQDFNDQVTEINECLTNIRDLNREIRDCEIYGDNALELRDERNRQIDKLSEYIHIRAVYTEEDIGSGRKIEKLSIYLDNDNPDALVHTDEAMLIDGVYGAQFYQPEKMPLMNPDYNKAGADTEKYMYLMELKAGDKNPITGAELTDADVAAGNNVFGTNDPQKATQVRDNDDFSLQISKLYDIHDEEWTSSSAERKAVDAEKLKDLAGKNVGDKVEIPDQAGNKVEWTLKAEPEKAEFRFKVGTTGEWKVGDTVQVGEDNPPKTITITQAMLDDPAELAKAIANEITPPDGYEVKAVGDELVYTAEKGGRVGKSGPAAAAKAPTFKPGNPDNGARITMTAGDSSRGKEAVFTPPEPNPGDPVPNPVTGDDIITSYQQINGTWYEVTTTVKKTYETAMDYNDLHGSLQATRELLTKKGEFSTADTIANIDEAAADKRGIPYYQLSLDLLANQLAEHFNQLNQGYQLNEKGNYTNENYEELTIAGEPVSAYNGLLKAQSDQLIGEGYFLKDKNGDPIEDEDGNRTADLNAWLAEEKNGAVSMGGPLFSNCNNNDETEGIDASNISVSHSWTINKVNLVPKYEVLFGGDLDHTTQNINAEHMVNLMEKGLLFNPQDLFAAGDPNMPKSEMLFKGNFNDMFSYLNTNLGGDIRANNIALNTHYTQQVEIDTQRDGVSGVDLNDEAMNMMQFQKAMNAAMRVMTAIDEVLDRLINNTGVAGR